MKRWWGTAVLLAGLLPGCVSKHVRAVAHDVFTLRSGTISALKAQRGTGPFRRYEVAPDELLDLIAEAAGKARDLWGRPVGSVDVSRHYREVVAKERAPDAPADPGYSEDWRTAVVVTVHPVEGEPGASRVEIHAGRRSPLLGGRNDWQRSLPGWIDEVRRERAAARPSPPACR